MRASKTKIKKPYINRRNKKKKENVEEITNLGLTAKKAEDFLGVKDAGGPMSIEAPRLTGCEYFSRKLSYDH